MRAATTSNNHRHFFQSSLLAPNLPVLYFPTNKKKRKKWALAKVLSQEIMLK
jgi:hypothetical protein